MSNEKWTAEEELDLIKNIANGLNIDLIAQKHNRSNSAIELRLKRIIFENINNKISPENISKLLKLDIDKIKQYYYSYKEFKEKHSKNIHPINLIDPINQTNLNQSNNIELKIESKNNLDNLNLEKIFHEPSSSEKLNLKLKKIKTENEILNLVIENKKLKEQLDKLIQEGKVDPSIKLLIKYLRKI
jgi:hypothetical protein